MNVPVVSYGPKRFAGNPGKPAVMVPLPNAVSTPRFGQYGPSSKQIAMFFATVIGATLLVGGGIGYGIARFMQKPPAAQTQPDTPQK